MALSRLVEKALTLDRIAGGPLVSLVVEQLSIPYFAASTTVRSDVLLTNSASSYASVAVSLEVTDAYPNAFSITFKSGGMQIASMSPVNQGDKLDLWQLITGRDMFWIEISNQDTLPHGLTLRSDYLSVATIDDLEELKDRLNAIDGVAETAELASLREQIKKYQSLQESIMLALAARSGK